MSAHQQERDQKEKPRRCSRRGFRVCACCAILSDPRVGFDRRAARGSRV